MKVIEIKEKKIWDKFLLNSAKVHFLQSWEWGDFERDGLGKKIFRMGIENKKGDIVCICLVTEEVTRFGKFLYAPRGPILDWGDSKIGKESLACLSEYFNAKGYFCLRFDPAVEKTQKGIVDLFESRGFQSAVDFVQVERAWFLDIEGKSEEELMLGMRKKARYSLKKAMKAGIEISASDSVEDFEDFLDILETISIRKHFPTVPREYLMKQFKMLDFMKFFYAKHNDEIIAGGFFAFHGNESTYLRGATSDSLSSSQASYLLQWEAIRYAQSLGLKRHNFMGVAEDKNYHPGYPAFGYSNFKRGFGGYLEEYMRTKDFVYNMVKYKLLTLNQWYRKCRYKGCN